MEKSTRRRSKHAVSATSRDVGGSSEPLPAWDRRTWLVAIPLALIVIAAFIPALDNGFVEWDDSENFVDNPFYRGLGIAQVKWAWSTLWVGVYQPLGWLLFETQYVVWKLDPRGYHLTSLLLLRQRCRSVCLDGHLACPMPDRLLLEESVGVRPWRGARDRPVRGAPAAS
jgi:hypothetical protein